jgi:hypothetical protein
MSPLLDILEPMSAFGGKADIDWTCGYVRL